VKTAEGPVADGQPQLSYVCAEIVIEAVASGSRAQEKGHAAATVACKETGQPQLPAPAAQSVRKWTGGNGDCCDVCGHPEENHDAMNGDACPPHDLHTPAAAVAAAAAVTAGSAPAAPEEINLEEEDCDAQPTKKVKGRFGHALVIGKGTEGEPFVLNKPNLSADRKYYLSLFLSNLKGDRWRFKEGHKRITLIGDLEMQPILSFLHTIKTDLCVSLRQRYPDHDHMRTFWVLDPSTYAGFDNEIAELKHKHFFTLARLLTKYSGEGENGQRLFTLNTIDEVNRLKFQFHKMVDFMVKMPRTISFSNAWATLIADNRALELDLILPLAQLCIVTPVQSADVERGFSQLNLVKNQLTNRMKVS
jgi:hypothetical protein